MTETTKTLAATPAEDSRADTENPIFATLAEAGTDTPRELPPDPEGMNADRAEWAAAAFRHFQCVTGCDYEDSLRDLLADLMHWCDRNNFDFELALFRAQGHHQAETRPAIAMAEPPPP